MVLVVSAHGLMTCYTGHHLARQGVQNLRPHRMREFPLHLVAFYTDIITVSSQHCQVSACMGVMTVVALVDIRMFEGTVPVSGNGNFMTGCTYLPFTGLEQIGSIACMRRMAVQTGITFMQGQMAAGFQHLFLNTLVTFQTGRHGYAGRGVVAFFASLLVRFVEDIADQGGTITAMRTVTGKAASQSTGVVPMPLLKTGRFVAGETEIVRTVSQQSQIVCLVRFMTDSTPAFGKRFVSLRKLPWHLGMTVETDLVQIITDKTAVVTDMRSMAYAAASIGNRRMNNTLMKDLLPVFVA